MAAKNLSRYVWMGKGRSYGCGGIRGLEDKFRGGGNGIGQGGKVDIGVSATVYPVEGVGIRQGEVLSRQV